MPRWISWITSAVVLVAAGSLRADNEKSPAGAGKKGPGDKGAASATGEKKTEPAKGETTGSKKVDMSAVDADEKAEKGALEALGAGFKVKRTQHYSVLYNTSDEDVNNFGAAIEQTYRSCMNYTLKLDIPVKPPKKKLLIFYFQEHKDYSAFSKSLGKGELAQSMPGIYFPDLNRSMFYNFQNTDTFKKTRETAESEVAELQARLKAPGVSADDRKRISREIAAAKAKAQRAGNRGGDVSETVVQHEVSHQVLWNIGFHNPKTFFANPRWFAEGTAMMFEPISDGSSANFGAVNSERLGQFRNIDAAGKLFPIKELIGTPKYFANQATIGIAYAQSWAIVHYLNRVKRKQLKEYVAIINARPADFQPTAKQEIADFEKCFGEIDDIWLKNWKNWMKKVN